MRRDPPPRLNFPQQPLCQLEGDLVAVGWTVALDARIPYALCRNQVVGRV